MIDRAWVPSGVVLPSRMKDAFPHRSNDDYYSYSLVSFEPIIRQYEWINNTLTRNFPTSSDSSLYKRNAPETDIVRCDQYCMCAYRHQNQIADSLFIRPCNRHCPCSTIRSRRSSSSSFCDSYGSASHRHLCRDDAKTRLDDEQVEERLALRLPADSRWWLVLSH